jgi:hypothetical protein
MRDMSIIELELLREENVPIEKLRIAPTNNRVFIPESSDIWKMLEDSIRAVGVTDPISLNEDYEIVSGQLRYLISKKLGKPSVPSNIYRFKSKYHERIYSILMDTCRNPLVDVDKYNFVKNAIENDKKSVDELSLDTGIPISTLRSWYTHGKTPDVITDINEEMKNKSEVERKEAQQAIDTYMKGGIKAKRAGDRLLNREPFKNNPKQALEFIKVTPKMPLRQVENLVKKIDSGIEIDFEKEKEMMEIKTELWNLRIPIEDKNTLFAICKEKKLDPDEIILKLIKLYIEDKVQL